jgi:hypothetical protein
MTSVWHLLAFVGYILGCLAFGLTSIAIHWKMVDDVNARLDEKDRYDLLFWHPAKSINLIRDYRRLYPDGRLLHYQFALIGTLIAIAVVVITGVEVSAWLKAWR